MMKKRYFILILHLFFTSAKAQLPTVGDCLGAIPICSTYYDEPDPYIWEGTGNYPNEILRGENDGCMIDERNGMWYTFTSLNDGLLRFIITPHDSLTDYDWNVFDITYGRCSDLKTKPNQFKISSNTYGAFETTPEQSLTGANTLISGGTGNCNGPGVVNGPAWNDDIPVYTDHIYLIYISNWSASADGYSIDFSESTADIWDRKPPALNTLLDAAHCGETSLEILFSENVLCNKISKDFFRLKNSTTEYSVLSAISTNCEKGGTYSREFTLELSKALEPDNYTLYYTDTICDICGNKTVSDSILFQIEPLKIEKVEIQNVLCFGDSTGSAQITVSGGVPTYTYLWSNNGLNSSIENVPFGEYFVTATAVNGCEVSTTVEINQTSELKLNLTGEWATSNIIPDGSIFVDIEGGTPSYEIEVQAQNLRPPYDLNALYSDLYTIILTDENGCQASDTLTIKPLTIESEIEIPNVFTPNNDGLNDLFLLKAHGIVSFSCIIVNRWGRQVYAWNNLNEGWDGKIKSTQASEGVYFYVVNALGLDKKKYLLKGSFYLMR